MFLRHSERGYHAIMNLAYNGNEPVWATKLGHYLPQTLSAHDVKGLCEINKGCVDISVLFLAFLQKLSCRKGHVYCSSFGTTPALSLALR